MLNTALLYRSLKSALVMAFIAGLASLSLAQSPKSKAAADIASLLKKHDAAMNQQNLDGVIQMDKPSGLIQCPLSRRNNRD